MKKTICFGSLDYSNFLNEMSQIYLFCSEPFSSHLNACKVKQPNPCFTGYLSLSEGYYTMLQLQVRQNSTSSGALADVAQELRWFSYFFFLFC